MSDFNQPQVLDSENQGSNELPSMLNVLTILTIIGSAFGAIMSVYNYFTICKSVDKFMSKDMPEMGGTLGKMMDNALEMMTKQCDSRLVIFVATLATSIICLFGALLMRKLKKQGLIVYIFGEIIGPASMMVILGMNSMAGIAMILGLIVPIVFVILYASQRKYLIH